MDDNNKMIEEYCKDYQMHIFLSHDWPRGIWDYGDKEGMLRRKDRSGDMRREMA